MTYELTAQPMHEDGSMGFDDRDPITCTDESFIDAAKQLDALLGVFPDVKTWDLTLAIRKPKRHAIIWAAPAAVTPYLPDNYKVVDYDAGGRRPETGDSTIIEGEDVAGWTLDGYVLPRLASGLIFGEEVDLSHV